MLFLKARAVAVGLQMGFYRRVLGMDIGDGAFVSMRARLDFTNPRGVHVGEGTYVAFDSIIFAHDMSRLLHTHTYVGKFCFIGAQAIIMPGVRIGDHCIIGSGAVVTRDVPSGSIVAGNPAKVIRSGIRTVKWGIREDIHLRRVAEEAQQRAEVVTSDE
jgi:acetyltransferase-like isoleucine patch superfamily enzyme